MKIPRTSTAIYWLCLTYTRIAILKFGALLAYRLTKAGVPAQTDIRGNRSEELLALF